MNRSAGRAGLLIDLDGTVYKGATAIPHAAEAVERLRSEGVPYLFLTNNSSRTPAAVAEQLRSMGFTADEGDVYTSSMALVQYLSDNRLGPDVYCIGQTGLQEALRTAGFRLNEGQPNVVVQGIDNQLTYDKLVQAVRYIQEGVPYILTNPDLQLPTDKGIVPGAGAISAAIQAASGTLPVVIGKPSAIITRLAAERLGTSPERTWVVGDNPHTDIGAGKAYGCRTALVLTGLAGKENYAELISASGFLPDRVCCDLLELVERLLKEGFEP